MLLRCAIIESHLAPISRKSAYREIPYAFGHKSICHCGILAQFPYVESGPPSSCGDVQRKERCRCRGQLRIQCRPRYPTANRCGHRGVSGTTNFGPTKLECARFGNGIRTSSIRRDDLPSRTNTCRILQPIPDHKYL